jgi:hypothetical protein
LPVAPQQGEAVLARLGDLRPCAGAVEPIGDVALPPGNREPHAAVEDADQFVRLKINRREVIEVERAAVRKQDFDTACFRSHAVPSEKRHVRRGVIDFAVALDDGGAIHERHVRRWIGVDDGFLCADSARRQQNTGCCDDSKEPHRDLDGEAGVTPRRQRNNPAEAGWQGPL